MRFLFLLVLSGTFFSNHSELQQTFYSDRWWRCDSEIYESQDEQKFTPFEIAEKIREMPCYFEEIETPEYNFYYRYNDGDSVTVVFDDYDPCFNFETRNGNTVSLCIEKIDNIEYLSGTYCEMKFYYSKGCNNYRCNKTE